MTHTWFDARNTALRDLFEAHLPSRLLARIMPRPVDKDGKDRKSRAYRLYLDPLNIRLIESG